MSDSELTFRFQKPPAAVAQLAARSARNSNFGFPPQLTPDDYDVEVIAHPCGSPKVDRLRSGFRNLLRAHAAKFLPGAATEASASRPQFGSP
jgi:hypothetical protein